MPRRIQAFAPPFGREAVPRVVSRTVFLVVLVLLLVLLGGCGERAADVGSIQGAGHVSPLADRAVTVTGVVVAEGSDAERPMCWIEGEDDGDPATSRGLFVLDATAPVGRQVRVAGTVRELGGDEELSVTALVADELGVLGTVPTPDPVVLSFSRGAADDEADDGRDDLFLRRPPSRVIEDDGMTRFEPSTDGLDFWESLEGMRVRLPEPMVVGATHRGSFYAVPGPVVGDVAGPRTRSGGLRLTPDDENPEKILVVGRLLHESVPELAVGDGLASPLDGVVHYRGGHFQLLPTHLPRSRPAVPRVMARVPDDSLPNDSLPEGTPPCLELATANVLNLSPLDPPEKFRALARQITGAMDAPDLVALQEVQDESGAVDDGTVSADGTLRRLVDAVAAAGGPVYRWSQVNPRNNADGGRPGGNIRVVLLHDPARLEHLGHARLEDRAFSADPARGWEGSRKPLVASYRRRAGSSLLHVANLHLRSKGGDDSPWGARQPPRRPSEEQRSAQAAAVAEWVRGVLDADPEARIAVLGDLNEYPWRPPLRILEEAGLESLVPRLPPKERYTYVYRGNAIVLDHVLVSPALAPDATIRALHLNADLPLARQVSDHDPLVARICR